jgi:hypothetical protein
MPQLLLFLPCEKAIVNEQDNNLSVIEILDTVNVTVPGDFEVPQDAVAPLQWAIVTVWQITPEDSEKQYEQRTCVIHPDGRETLVAIGSIAVLQGKQRTIVMVTNYPVGQEGEYAVSLSLREASDGSNWREISRYPVTVTYKKQAQEVVP